MRNVYGLNRGGIGFLLMALLALSLVVGCSSQSGGNGEVKESSDWLLFCKSNEMTTDDTGRTTTYEYDGQGRLTLEKESRRAAISHEIAYEYNEVGDKVRSVLRTYGSDNELRSQRTEEFEYDRNRKLVRKTIVSDDGDSENTSVVETEYDNKGNKVYEQTLNESGDVIGWREYTYDQHGNMTYSEQSSGISQMCSYDERGNLLSELWERGNGSVAQNCVYAYDEQNRLVFEAKRNDGVDPEEDAGNGSYFFYDDSGNCIQKIRPSFKDSDFSSEYLRIYDSNNLLLLSFSGSSVTTYEYRNAKTGEIVSGLTYFEKKYVSDYAVNMPDANAPVGNMVDIFDRYVVADEGMGFTLSTAEGLGCFDDKKLAENREYCAFDGSCKEAYVFPTKGNGVKQGECDYFSLSVPDALGATIYWDKEELEVQDGATVGPQVTVDAPYSSTDFAEDDAIDRWFCVTAFKDWLPQGDYIVENLGYAADGEHEVWIYADGSCEPARLQLYRQFVTKK